MYPWCSVIFAQPLSCVLFILALWTVACQARLPVEFFLQGFWSRLPFPALGDLPDPGIEPISPASPALGGGFFPPWATWEAPVIKYRHKRCSHSVCHRCWYAWSSYDGSVLRVTEEVLWLRLSSWKSLSRVWVFATPWTIQSMEFSRPEYWSGYPFPPPGDLPNPGIEPKPPAWQVNSLPAEPQTLLKVSQRTPVCERNGKGWDLPWRTRLTLFNWFQLNHPVTLQRRSSLSSAIGRGFWKTSV